MVLLLLFYLWTLFFFFYRKHEHLCPCFLIQAISFRSQDFLKYLSISFLEKLRWTCPHSSLCWCVLRSELGGKIGTSECDRMRKMFTQTKYNNCVGEVSYSSAFQLTGLPYAVPYLFFVPLQSPKVLFLPLLKVHHYTILV